MIKIGKHGETKMIRSMTGYGRGEAVIGGKKIVVEIKSVNHRFADISLKVPRCYSYLEDPLRKYTAEHITRGKADVFLNIEDVGGSEENIALDTVFAKKYIAALEELRDTFGLKDDISVMTVAKNPDIFKVERAEDDKDALWEAVKTVADEAVEAFTDMRIREGERIGKDLRARVEYMKTVAAEINSRSPETVKEYSDRLYKKIKEVLDDRTVDEARVLTEVAIFADKVAVNEEIVRLASHFDEFYEILSSDAPAGRRLDFLIQEINRETNTIGSKANDLFIAQKVVELKAEIEKLREQIQNIE